MASNNTHKSGGILLQNMLSRCQMQKMPVVIGIETHTL